MRRKSKKRRMGKLEKTICYDKHLTLELEGRETEIKRLVKQAKDIYFPDENPTKTDFSFQKFSPVPKELLDDGLKEEQWCLDNWGIPGDVVATYNEQKKAYHFIIEDREQIPIEGLLTISRKFPNIYFTLSFKFAQFNYNRDKNGGMLMFNNGQVRHLIV